MARTSLLAQSLAKLLEAEGDTVERHVDLCISLRVYETGEELVRVGGKWDRRLKRYTANAKNVRVLAVHKGQEVAARWFAGWLRFKCKEVAALKRLRKKTKDAVKKLQEKIWAGFRRVWSALFIGGRRGGKSRLAVWAVCIFATTFGGSNSWCISPTQEETEELEAAIRETLPRSWYRYRGDPRYEFRLGNGSIIKMLSGHKPRTLKRGGVDFALYNEGQNMSNKGFVQVRGATADSGGLTIVAANPPDEPIGFWVEEFHEKASAQKVKAEAFFFNPEDNPFIEYQSLADMADEVDDEVYRRDVLGEFVPIGDVVMHAWNDLISYADVPSHFIDITAEFTKLHLGRAFGHFIGADFQLTPHMAAVVYKVYRDPADEQRTPMLWIVDEIIVENADEDELIDGLENPSDGIQCPCCIKAGRVGYRGWREDGDSETDPAVCAVIPDASGEWQDAARTKGKGSFDWFRARGWTFLYKPDAKMEKNPVITERCKAANALLKSRSGVRRLFVSKHCIQTRRSMKHWENKSGAPNKRSKHAHICDAATYPIWRFFPRRKAVKGPTKESIQNIPRMSRAKEMRGWT